MGGCGGVESRAILMLKLVESYLLPLPSEFMCVLVLGPLALGHLIRAQI